MYSLKRFSLLSSGEFCGGPRLCDTQPGDRNATPAIDGDIGIHRSTGSFPESELKKEHLKTGNISHMLSFNAEWVFLLRENMISCFNEIGWCALTIYNSTN